MVQYSKSDGVRGAWLEKSIDLHSKRVKLVSEVTPQESQWGSQDVAKVQISGETEIKNFNINKPTVNALIEAFGTDSKDWINKVLTIHAEKMMVSGKRVVAVYLVPEGFQMTEDEGGYLVILRKNTETAQGTALPTQPVPTQTTMPPTETPASTSSPDTIEYPEPDPVGPTF